MLSAIQFSSITALTLLTTSMLSTFLFYDTGYVVAFGPLSGIGLGVLLNTKGRHAWGVGLGAFIFYVWHLTWSISTSSWLVHGGIAVAIGFGYMVQAMIGAELVPRQDEQVQLSKVSDILLFLLLPGAAACGVSAACATLALWAGGLIPFSGLVKAWLWWWLWDLVGVLIFPLAVLCVLGQPAALWQRRRLSLLPTLALMMMGIVAGLLLVPQGRMGLPPWVAIGFLGGALFLLGHLVGHLLFITGQNQNFEKLVFEKAHELANAESAVLLANDEIQDLDAELLHSHDLLKEREKRLKSIIETATDAILSFDQSGQIEDVNPATVELFGYPRDVLLTMKLDDLLPNILSVETTSGEFNLEEFRNPWLRRLKGSYEAQGKHLDGSVVSVDCVISLRESRSNMKFTAILRDISERKRVDRMKSEFVSIVSHELRTPLTSIGGSLRLLESGTMGKLSSQGEGMVEIAIRNARRLERLVDDILDFDKLQSGSMPIEMVEFDPASLLHQALGRLGAFADEAKVVIKPSVDGSLKMRSDPHRFEQVIVNLVSNAIKFSPPKGEVEVCLNTIPASGGTEQLRVAVRDRGPGIHEEQMPNLFKRFSQGDASTRRKYGGTGLGLAISKEIVALLGGTIGVDSVPGQGSTFWFSLPIESKPKHN